MGIGIAFIVVLVIIIGIIGFIIGIYNSLVRLRNQVDNAWSQIDVQLKRRHDLIPNLIETAKGYMKHESDTLTQITEARAAAMGAGNVKDAAKAEGALGQALSQFSLVVENYPDLKANQNFLALQEELTATEGRVAYARQFYNDSVLGYNNKIESVPTVFLAKMLGYQQREYFEADDAARAVPNVDF